MSRAGTDVAGVNGAILMSGQPQFIGDAGNRTTIGLVTMGQLGKKSTSGFCCVVGKCPDRLNVRREIPGCGGRAVEISVVGHDRASGSETGSAWLTTSTRRRPKGCCIIPKAAPRRTTTSERDWKPRSD